MLLAKIRINRVCWASCLGIWFASVGLAADAPDPYLAAKQVDRLLADEEAGKRAGEPGKAVPLADDATFLRRAFFDLVGSPPTQDEVLSFCLDTDSQKRERLIKDLLADQDFGNNWAKYWRDVILYRRTEDRALLISGYLTGFLADQFNRNRPWSETATELITASGLSVDRGQTGLIIAHGAVPEEVTAEVSRIFLGVQIQCAQCHDHPTDPWKREQFHQLAAFFPRIGMRVNQDDLTISVTTIDTELRRRRDLNIRIFGTLEHQMPDKDDPKAAGKLMQPAFFLTDQKLPTGSNDATRRGTLAKWITDQENPWFAKAYVNRIWTELIGEGFYESVDDLGPMRDCAAPKTLEFLSQSFARHGYDSKWLFTAIMATNAYQQKSQDRQIASKSPALTNCAQRLRAEQLLDSLIYVLNLEGRLPPPPANGGPIALRRDVRFVFNQLFGYDPSGAREDVMSTIPQVLMLMNSPMLHQAISATRRDALGGLLTRNRENHDAVVELYVNTLGRTPTDEEMSVCLDYVKTVRNRGEAFEDILWSLINSTEFAYRR